jgi:hypothetical protein
MPFPLELAMLLVCSVLTGWHLARNPRLPEYMTSEADRPVRERVQRARRQRSYRSIRA